MEDIDNNLIFNQQDMAEVAEQLLSPNIERRRLAAQTLANLATKAAETELGSKRLVASILEARHIENAMADSERQYKALFENASDGIMYIAQDGIIIELNKSFAKMHGYTLEEMQGMTLQEIDVEDVSSLHPERTRQTMKGNDLRFEVQHYHKDGHIIILEVTQFMVELKSESHIVAFHRDITERVEAERALQNSEERFRSLYNNMNESAALHKVIYDNQGAPIDYVYVEANSAFEKQIGRSRDSVIGKTSREVYGAATTSSHLETYARVVMTKEPETFETYYPLLDKYFAVRVYCPYEGSFATIFEDITKRKKLELELTYLGLHDALTGLYSRYYFEEMVHVYENSRQYPISVIGIDVDDLRVINNSWGHEAGDRLLKRVSAVLKDVFRSEDCVARVGGDEFVILLPNVDEETAKKTVKRIKVSLTKHNLNYLNSPLSLSMGHATNEASENHSLEETIKLADDRMYEDKYSKKQPK